MTVADQMQHLIERMYSGGVARPGELRGCSAAEIAALETKYSLKLPASYSLFLATMGHAMGRLGECNCWKYEDVLSLTDAERMTWDQCRHEQIWWKRRPADKTDYPPRGFPDHGLIFCMLPGLPDFWAIVCEGQEDSPVIHFDYEEVPVRFTQTHDSLLGFLEMCCEEAERAIRDGLL